MNGWSGYQNSPAKAKKDKAPKATKPKYNKDRHETIEYINDAEDQLEWLNEDLFNEKISKAQYDAKAKLLNMKIDAGRKAAGFDKMTKKDLEMAKNDERMKAENERQERLGENVDEVD